VVNHLFSGFICFIVLTYMLWFENSIASPYPFWDYSIAINLFALTDPHPFLVAHTINSFTVLYFLFAHHVWITALLYQSQIGCAPNFIALLYHQAGA